MERSERFTVNTWIVVDSVVAVVRSEWRYFERIANGTGGEKDKPVDIGT